MKRWVSDNLKWVVEINDGEAGFEGCDLRIEMYMDTLGDPDLVFGAPIPDDATMKFNAAVPRYVRLVAIDLVERNRSARGVRRRLVDVSQRTDEARTDSAGEESWVPTLGRTRHGVVQD